MLRGVEAGEERTATGRAHRGVAHCLVETQPVIGNPLAVGQILFSPALGPVHRPAFLIGDDDNDVGFLRKPIGGCCLYRHRAHRAGRDVCHSREDKGTDATEERPARQ